MTKNFFDYPLKVKKQIIKSAAINANKMQMETMQNTKQNNNWIERWNKLTDTSNCPDGVYEANKWLAENKTIYEEEIYGEPMFDFNEDKLKSFIQDEINKAFDDGFKRGAITGNAVGITEERKRILESEVMKEEEVPCQFDDPKWDKEEFRTIVEEDDRRARRNELRQEIKLIINDKNEKDSKNNK